MPRSQFSSEDRANSSFRGENVFRLFGISLDYLYLYMLQGKSHWSNVLAVNISIGTARLLLGGFTAPTYASWKSQEHRDNVTQPFLGIYLEILHDIKHSLGRGPYAGLNPSNSLKFLLYLYFSQSVEDADCFHE